MSVESAPQIDADTTASLAPSLRWPFLGISAVAFVGFILFVIGYGIYGERLTAGVDAACAEAAFQDGKKIEAAGNLELAIQRYRQALEGEFTSKDREYQCRRSIGEILYHLGRYQEAIEEYHRIPGEALSAPGHWTAYVSALWHAGQNAEAEKLGKVWLTMAREHKDNRQQVWANATLGHLAEDAGRLDEAFQYYGAAAEIEPGNQAALCAAQVLEKQGRTAEAIRRLDSFLAVTKAGPLYEDARKLRAQLKGKG